MLNFYQLTPEEFEDLCYQYICSLYQKPNYEVMHTRYAHDGGRDIEITFYDELSSFRIWAECKRHQRNIGLENIGKNVVLVISKHINRVIFFSTSEITESAKIEITNIADKFNFDVSFLCGARLSEEIQTQSALVKKFFGDMAVTVNPQLHEDPLVYFTVSEFESNTITPIHQNQVRVILREGTIFNIYVHISNRTHKHLFNIHIELSSGVTNVRMSRNTADYKSLLQQTDVIAQFRGEIINRRSASIELPTITVTYQSKEKSRINSYNKVYTLPVLDLSKCKNYPFIGRRVTEFLSEKVNRSLEWCERNYPQIFDLRGVSGSGKSRLSMEIHQMALHRDFKSVYLNGVDYIECDLIRKLLCELLHLPFYHGKINYSSEDIFRLIRSQGGSDTFTDAISDFLVTGSWKESKAIYLIEAVAHFMLAPIHEKGYCITLDNLQAMHPIVFKFITRLVDILTQNQGKSIIILISNTEREPAYAQKHFQGFLTYLSCKINDGCKAIVPYTCTAFSEADLKVLLMDLFLIHEQNDPLLNKLLKRTGRLPFELIMTIEYLSEMRIISWLDVNTWKINDQIRFSAFLSKGLPDKISILPKRVESWRNIHSQSENDIFTEILATIVSFEGLLPYSYCTENRIKPEILDEMMDSLWLVQSTSGKGIEFFHDNIYDYCSAQPIYRKNAIVLKKVLRWLKENPNANIARREKINFLCYYHLNLFEATKNYGLCFLHDQKNQSYSDITDVSRLLYEEPCIQESPADYFFVAETYANAIFRFDNKELGSEIYANIVTYIQKNTIEIEISQLCKILHHAVNSQLQSARYNTALQWLSVLNNLQNIPEDYQFIVENRYGVAYIARGEFEEAKMHLDASLQFASETMHNLYWSSTTHSDLALYYYYFWQANGRENTRQYIIGEFEKALFDYEQYGKSDASRDIEMSWHQAFVHILNGKLNDAIRFSELCIKLSNQQNQIYGLYRGYNLQALAQFRAGDFDLAKSILIKTLHICEMCAFPSGVFRMYNNLGVIAYREGEYTQAKRFFKLAFETLDRQQIEFKQMPVLSNLLAVSFRCGDTALSKQIENICNQLSYIELYKFRKNLCLQTLENNQVERLTFWGYAEISYVF